MNHFISSVARRLLAALAAMAALCTVVVPAQALASAPGYPDVYCYRNATGSNPTRLLLAESNLFDGKLAYTIFTEHWDRGRNTYVDNRTPWSKFAAQPSDRTANGICRWADPDYPNGSWR